MGTMLNSKFTIPKRAASKELLEELDVNSRQYRDISSALQNSFWNANCGLEIKKIDLVNSNVLSAEYIEKKVSMQKKDARTNQELTDIYGYRFVENIKHAKEICKNGLTTKTKPITNIFCLGNPEYGIYLSRCADILTRGPPRLNRQFLMIIFKVIKGRIKVIAQQRGTGSAHMEPTPNFDGHFSKSFHKMINVPHPSHYSKIFDSCQMFLYEFDLESDDLYARRPKQCLPYAVVHFSFIEVQKPVKEQQPIKTIATQSSENETQASPDSLEPESLFLKELENAKLLWIGKLLNKSIILTDVKILCHTSNPIGQLPLLCDQLSFRMKLKIDQLKNLLPDKIFPLTPLRAKTAGVVKQGKEFLHAEMYPLNRRSTSFALLMKSLNTTQEAIVLKLPRGYELFMLPTCDLTKKLGITHDEYPNVLHLLFVKKITDLRQVNSRSQEAVRRDAMILQSRILEIEKLKLTTPVRNPPPLSEINTEPVSPFQIAHNVDSKNLIYFSSLEKDAIRVKINRMRKAAREDKLMSGGSTSSFASPANNDILHPHSQNSQYLEASNQKQNLKAGYDPSHLQSKVHSERDPRFFARYQQSNTSYSTPSHTASEACHWSMLPNYSRYEPPSWQSPVRHSEHESSRQSLHYQPHHSQSTHPASGSVFQPSGNSTQNAAPVNSVSSPYIYPQRVKSTKIEPSHSDPAGHSKGRSINTDPRLRSSSRSYPSESLLSSDQESLDSTTVSSSNERPSRNQAFRSTNDLESEGHASPATDVASLSSSSIPTTTLDALITSRVSGTEAVVTVLKALSASVPRYNTESKINSERRLETFRREESPDSILTSYLPSVDPTPRQQASKLSTEIQIKRLQDACQVREENRYAGYIPLIDNFDSGDSLQNSFEDYSDADRKIESQAVIKATDGIDVTENDQRNEAEISKLRNKPAAEFVVRVSKAAENDSTDSCKTDSVEAPHFRRQCDGNDAGNVATQGALNVKNNSGNNANLDSDPLISYKNVHKPSSANNQADFDDFNSSGKPIKSNELDSNETKGLSVNYEDRMFDSKSEDDFEETLSEKATSNKKIPMPLMESEEKTQEDKSKLNINQTANSSSLEMNDISDNISYEQLELSKNGEEKGENQQVELKGSTYPIYCDGELIYSCEESQDDFLENELLEENEQNSTKHLGEQVIENWHDDSIEASHGIYFDEVPSSMPNVTTNRNDSLREIPSSNDSKYLHITDELDRFVRDEKNGDGKIDSPDNNRGRIPRKLTTDQKFSTNSLEDNATDAGDVTRRKISATSNAQVPSLPVVPRDSRHIEIKGTSRDRKMRVVAEGDLRQKLSQKKRKSDAKKSKRFHDKEADLRHKLAKPNNQENFRERKEPVRSVVVCAKGKEVNSGRSVELKKGSSILGNEKQAVRNSKTPVKDLDRTDQLQKHDKARFNRQSDYADSVKSKSPGSGERMKSSSNVHEVALSEQENNNSLKSRSIVSVMHDDDGGSDKNYPSDANMREIKKRKKDEKHDSDKKRSKLSLNDQESLLVAKVIEKEREEVNGDKKAGGHVGQISSPLLGHEDSSDQDSSNSRKFSGKGSNSNDDEETQQANADNDICIRKLSLSSEQREKLNNDHLVSKTRDDVGTATEDPASEDVDSFVNNENPAPTTNWYDEEEFKKFDVSCASPQVKPMSNGTNDNGDDFMKPIQYTDSALMGEKEISKPQTEPPIWQDLERKLDRKESHIQVGDESGKALMTKSSVEVDRNDLHTNKTVIDKSTSVPNLPHVMNNSFENTNDDYQFSKSHTTEKFGPVQERDRSGKSEGNIETIHAPDCVSGTMNVSNLSEGSIEKSAYENEELIWENISDVTGSPRDDVEVVDMDVSENDSLPEIELGLPTNELTTNISEQADLAMSQAKPVGSMTYQKISPETSPTMHNLMLWSQNQAKLLSNIVVSPPYGAMMRNDDSSSEHMRQLFPEAKHFQELEDHVETIPEDEKPLLRDDIKKKQVPLPDQLTEPDQKAQPDQKGQPDQKAHPDQNEHLDHHIVANSLALQDPIENSNEQRYRKADKKSVFEDEKMAPDRQERGRTNSFRHDECMQRSPVDKRRFNQTEIEINSKNRRGTAVKPFFSRNAMNLRNNKNTIKNLPLQSLLDVNVSAGTESKNRKNINSKLFDKKFSPNEKKIDDWVSNAGQNSKFNRSKSEQKYDRQEKPLLRNNVGLAQKYNLTNLNERKFANLDRTFRRENIDDNRPNDWHRKNTNNVRAQRHPTSLYPVDSYDQTIANDASFSNREYRPNQYDDYDDYRSDSFGFRDEQYHSRDRLSYIRDSESFRIDSDHGPPDYYRSFDDDAKQVDHDVEASRYYDERDSSFRREELSFDDRHSWLNQDRFVSSIRDRRYQTSNSNHDNYRHRKFHGNDQRDNDLHHRDKREREDLYPRYEEDDWRYYSRDYENVDDRNSRSVPDYPDGHVRGRVDYYYKGRTSFERDYDYADLQASDRGHTANTQRIPQPYREALDDNRYDERYHESRTSNNSRPLDAVYLKRKAEQPRSSPQFERRYSEERESPFDDRTFFGISLEENKADRMSDRRIVVQRKKPKRGKRTRGAGRSYR